MLVRHQHAQRSLRRPLRCTAGSSLSADICTVCPRFCWYWWSIRLETKGCSVNPRISADIGANLTATFCWPWSKQRRGWSEVLQNMKSQNVFCDFGIPFLWSLFDPKKTTMLDLSSISISTFGFSLCNSSQLTPLEPQSEVMKGTVSSKSLEKN